MKRNKSILVLLLLIIVVSVFAAGCGNNAANTNATSETENTTSETSDNGTNVINNSAETTDTVKEEDTSTVTETPDVDSAESTEDSTGVIVSEAEGPLAINYEAEPDAFIGNWVLVSAYSVDDGMLEVVPDACYLEIEKSIDENKLVDETAYIHADAVNLKGTMSFDLPDVSVDDYSCSGSWDNWSIVDVQGEGKAYYKGAIKFKIRDDDEGVFFEVITGIEIEDMELLNVLGINEEGNLILGYSEDNIVKDGSAEWEYAYIFSQK